MTKTVHSRRPKIWIAAFCALLAMSAAASSNLALADSGQAVDSQLLQTLWSLSERSHASGRESREESSPGEQKLIPEGQKDLVRAQERGKGLNFVEVEDVPIVKILPTDNQGLRHQKFVVRLANGRTVTAVYNVSLNEHLPIQVGDIVSLGGQYIWERDGGILHWLHEDTRHRRPDGYVEVDGIRYGEVKGSSH